jgi:hypothetical protein
MAIAPLVDQESVDDAPDFTATGVAEKENTVGGSALKTLTVDETVELLFNVSYAIAVITCKPFAVELVFQLFEYVEGPEVAVTSEPRFVPSIWN